MKVASFEKREWIDPWRDRRPMTEDPVLVSIVENGKIEVAVGRYNAKPIDRGTHIVDIGWFVDGFHLREFVLAWMPLPEPYNPVEEEEVE